MSMAFISISRLFIFASAVLLLTAVDAKAAIQISVGSGTVDPSGTLRLDIGIDGESPSDKFSEFQLVLQITPMTAAGTSSLQFVPAQSEAVLEEADYVFVGDSDVILSGGDWVVDNTGDSITFFDLTFSLLDADVTSGQRLATIDVQHMLGTATELDVAGNTFSISVDEDLTELFNSDGDPVGYTSSSGTVMVNAVAIPEPASTVILMLGAGAMLLRRRR
ncbi:MAG: PEP-CTERM sorting domain-containing protein [Planctomycetales bacterium]|nr:PEP-CTERM sorting domain-containing protein [Planctomycetales bacterium]